MRFSGVREMELKFSTARTFPVSGSDSIPVVGSMATIVVSPAPIVVTSPAATVATPGSVDAQFTWVLMSP